MKRLVCISGVIGMLIGGVLAMGYQMAHHQETEDEPIVEQASIMSTPDSVKSEMALQLEREALLERVRAMYTLVKHECIYLGGSVDNDMLDKSFCSKSWNKLLMAVRSKEHNTGTLFFEVNKWTMTYDSDLVSFDEFEVQDLNMDANEMTATVNFTVYASDTYTPARIELVYEDGNWKIDNFYHLKYGLNLRSQMWDYLGNDLIYLI
ncbi:MAG: hypothetical protein J6I38_06075 [Prevotella sp.]|nr:hypothetical protein [Prevotella sp.]